MRLPISSALAVLLVLGGCGSREPSPAVPQRPIASASSPAARVEVAPEVAAFYRSNGFRPLWVTRAGLTPAGSALLGILGSAQSDGLDPSRYGLIDLRRAAAGAGQDAPSAARAELLLSQAFVAYVRDLYRPSEAARPYFVDPALASPVPSASDLLREAAASADLVAHLRAVRAINPVYDSLRKAYAAHPEQARGASKALVLANLERARALGPIRGRAVIVDAAGANLWMVDRGRVEGAMRVIVGKPDMPTPAMAATIRFASLNPYWNVPPDLARERARRVLKQGVGIVRAERLQVLSDWSERARPVDLARVDWRGAAAGKYALRMRQLPGPDNMMGRMKFMFPNRLGIYLHDTPFRSKFGLDDRRVSSGCVRLADAPRLARWLFGGRVPDPSRALPEQRVDLPEPVPVYITYLTVVPGNRGLKFQPDLYKRDPKLLAGLGGIPAKSRA